MVLSTPGHSPSRSDGAWEWWQSRQQQPLAVIQLRLRLARATPGGQSPQHARGWGPRHWRVLPLWLCPCDPGENPLRPCEPMFCPCDPGETRVGGRAGALCGAQAPAPYACLGRGTDVNGGKDGIIWRGLVRKPAGSKPSSAGLSAALPAGNPTPCLARCCEAGNLAPPTHLLQLTPGIFACPPAPIHSHGMTSPAPRQRQTPTRPPHKPTLTCPSVRPTQSPGRRSPAPCWPL